MTTNVLPRTRPAIGPALPKPETGHRRCFFTHAIDQPMGASRLEILQVCPFMSSDWDSGEIVKPW